MRRFSLRLFPFLLLAAIAGGVDVKIATLNCLLLFDPRVEHRGKVDDEQRMTNQQYSEKLANLATLIKGYQVVGLQETGGKTEVSALASRSGMAWFWEPGKDTATGEEVGLLYKLPGWKVTSQGRVRELDRLVSKHLLVDAKNDAHHVYFLVVHLLRPMGTQVTKHKAQIAAVGEWMNNIKSREPNSVIVVIGDTNSTLTENGTSLFGVGVEAGEQVRFQGTHLTNKAFDRMVLLGAATWQAVEIRKPPYGTRPAATVKRVWTDHYLLGATLRLE